MPSRARSYWLDCWFYCIQILTVRFQGDLNFYMMQIAKSLGPAQIGRSVLVIGNHIQFLIAHGLFFLDACHVVYTSILFINWSISTVKVSQLKVEKSPLFLFFCFNNIIDRCCQFLISCHFSRWHGLQNTSLNCLALGYSWLVIDVVLLQWNSIVH